MYDLDGTHDLVCWMEPCFSAALHPYVLVLVAVSPFFVTQFPLTSLYLHIGTCQLRLFLPLTRKLLVCDCDTVFFSLRSAMRAGRICFRLCISTFIRSSSAFHLFIGVPTLGADGYVLSC
jgi:hypothetical protein